MNTKKLLAGLGGDGISVRSLANYTSSNGVQVSVHVGRYRGTISLPPQLIIKGKLGEKTQKVYDEYISLGTLRFIPREYESVLASIESSARYKLFNSTIIDGFMPISKYIVYKEEFEELRNEYFLSRDIILMIWDDVIKDFKTGLDELMDAAGVTAYERGGLKDSILKQLPSKEQYSNSFSFALSVKAFPAQPDFSMFDEAVGKDIKESWMSLVVDNALNCISALAQDVFSMCSSAVAKYVEKGVINGKTINGLIVLGEKVKENNMFCNPLLQSVGESLCKLVNIDNPDDQEELVEGVLLEIYEYCQNTGVELKINNKGLPAKTLETMLENKRAQLKMVV